MWIRSTSALLSMWVVVLMGCSQGNIRRAEPIQVVLPAAVAKPAAGPVIPHGIRGGFIQAIDLLQQGALQDARDMLLLLKLQMPGLIGVHLNLALAHYHLDELRPALYEVDEVLRLAPRHVIAYNLRGSILRQMGRFTEARVDFTKAITVDPNYAPAYLNLAILFDIYMQYWEDAKGYYRHYLQLVPEERERIELWIEDLDLRIEMAGQ